MFWRWRKHKEFRKWLKEDDEKLLELKKRGLSDEEIAKELNRSIPAVRLRYYQLTKDDGNGGSIKGSSSNTITSNSDLIQLANRFGIGQDVLNSLMVLLDKRIEDTVRRVLAQEMPNIVNGAKSAIAQLIEDYAQKYQSLISPSDAQSGNVNPNPIGNILPLLSSLLSHKEPDINEIVEKRVNAEMDRIYKFIRLGTLIAKKGTIKKEDLDLI